MMGIMEKAETKPMTVYEQAFLARLPEGPEWLQAKRQQAFSRFEGLGFPNHRQEAWKYISLRPFLDTPFEPYEPAPETPVSYEQVSAHFLPEAYRVVLVNGHWVPATFRV